MGNAHNDQNRPKNSLSKAPDSFLIVLLAIHSTQIHSFVQKHCFSSKVEKAQCSSKLESEQKKFILKLSNMKIICTEMSFQILIL